MKVAEILFFCFAVILILALIAGIIWFGWPILSFHFDQFIKSLQGISYVPVFQL